ncbi:hypothetical protein NP233_g6522 [Leucocoprinus birnbaumii]|uniref:F-box domain-containing protein n=1 Tax=Leucocoprinus birnbaumii TaxID=56174 RepID=A0AAD5VTQ0_9AGAR|nr:hypothetical protein NP233_g6522 [Leucocoprinus birnbaumii]
MSVLPPIHTYADIIEATRPPSPLDLPYKPPKPRTLVSVQQYLHASSTYHHPITKVPSEILYEIFLLYFTTSPALYIDEVTSGPLKPGLYTNLDQQLNPFTLSHVCAAWRAVIANSSKLWSQLVIVGPLLHQWYAISTWLTRAREDTDVTLIQLDLRSSQQELEEATDKALCAILHHSPCIRRLRLEFRCSEWQWALALFDPRRLDCLKEFHVEFPPWSLPRTDRDRFWANIFQGPKLQRVSWKSTDLCPTFHLTRWQYLTSVNISGRITQKNLWTILRITPRLVRLRVQGIYVPTPIPDPNPILPPAFSIPPPPNPTDFRPFVHTSLRHLDVEFKCSPALIYQNLRLPCLTSLKVTQNSTGYDLEHPRLPMSSLIALIFSTSLHCGLTHLTIRDPTASEARLCALLSMKELSNLEYLGLEYVSPRIIDRLNQTLVKPDEKHQHFS